jgi:hypothetical protein
MRPGVTESVPLSVNDARLAGGFRARLPAGNTKRRSSQLETSHD